MSGLPDPKPPVRERNRARRIEDPAAVHAATLGQRECVACGHPGSNGHHVLPRGQGGDDVQENIVTLCGTGTGRCHGATHGSPYVDEDGRRWREDDVRRAIGDHLLTHRPDTIAYVLGRFGTVAGADYLRRRYHVLPSPIALAEYAGTA